MRPHAVKLKWRVLEVLVLLAIITGGSFFVFVLAQRLEQRMQRLKEQVVVMLEEQLGRRISYESISPSVFGYLAVRNFTVYSFEDPDETLLRVSRLKIYYDILRFLATKNPVQSLTEIQIANSQFTVDYHRDRELIDFARSLLQSRPGSRPGPGQEGWVPVTLSGTNITLDYRHGDQEVMVSGLFFSVSSAQSRYRVSVRGSIDVLYLDPTGGFTGLARERDRWAGRPDGTGGRELRRLQSRVKITGSVDQQLKWSDLGIRIYSLSAEGLALKRQTLQLVSNDKGLQVRKIQDRAPLDIQFLFDVATGDLSFRFVAEGFRPATLMELSGRLERYNRFLSSALTGNGFVTYNLNEGSLRYGSELTLELPPGVLPIEATLRTHLRGNEQIVYLDPLSLDSSAGKVEFRGSLLTANLFPSGLLTVEGLRPPGARAISTSLLFRRVAGSLAVEGTELRVGDVVFNDIRLDLAPAGRAFDFDLGASLDDGRRPGTLGVSGTLRLAPEPELSLSAAFDRLPPGSIVRLVAPPGEAARILTARLEPYSLSLTAELWTDFRRFSVSSPRVELVDSGSPDRRLSFALEASEELLHLEELELLWGEYRLTGMLDAQSSARETSARSLLWIQGIPYELEAVYRPGGEVSLKGSYGLEVSLRASGVGDPVLFPDRFRPLEGMPFKARAASMPVPLPGGILTVSLDVVGIYTTGGTLIARSDACELRDIPLRTIGSNSVQFGFLLQDRDLRIDRIRYSDRVSELAGAGSVVLRDLAPLTAAARVNLADAGAQERYALALDIQEGALEGRLEFDRAPLERLGDLAVTGDAAGSIGVSGTLQDPVVELAVALQDGRLNIDPIGGRLSLRVSRQRLDLESLSLEFLTHRIEGASGTVDFGSGAFFLGLPYRADYFGQDVRLFATLEGTIRDPAALLEGEPVLSAELDGAFRMQDIRVDGEGRPDWRLGLSARDGVLSIDGGSREGIDATVSADGRFTAVMQQPLPIRGTARGQLRQGRIESVFDVDSLDMRIIAALTPFDDIWNFEGGTAKGSVRVTGPVNDPDWYGRMDVTGLLMSVKLSPDVLGPVSGTVYFDEKTFSFPRLATTAGKARIEGEGVFYIDHWLPVAVELMLYVDQEPGGHIRYTFGPIFVDGYGTGAIRITSDQSTVRVEGKVQALNCRVALGRQDSAEAGSVPAAPPVPLTVDVKIQTGRGVEFFWPAMNFPVVHSYVKQGENIHVFLDESTGDLVIKGRAEMRGGEVFYFDRSFYLKEGSIAFEETIGDIDPWIQALAEARERDVNNEDIRIYLEANNRLSQFSPRFYSVPSRPDVEILDMIGGTIINRFEDSDFGTAAVMLTSDIVGQFGILTPFERAVRDVLRLDLFSIRTQFLQNVLFGKILGQDSGLAAINPLDNTTLSLGKYLGTDLFLEALIRFQAVNDIDAVNSIRTEGELSLEWATPFFLLEWTFTPLHPESLFLADNSIGLSWKFSY